MFSCFFSTTEVVPCYKTALKGFIRHCLKPDSFLMVCGTTEVMPCHEPAAEFLNPADRFRMELAAQRGACRAFTHNPGGY